jgi:hypothetical protein
MEDFKNYRNSKMQAVAFKEHGDKYKFDLNIFPEDAEKTIREIFNFDLNIIPEDAEEKFDRSFNLNLNNLHHEVEEVRNEGVQFDLNNLPEEGYDEYKGGKKCGLNVDLNKFPKEAVNYYNVEELDHVWEMLKCLLPKFY